MTQPVKQALIDARALLARGWVQYHYAVDKRGRTVKYHSPNAVCFCALGAIHRSSPTFFIGGMARRVIVRIIGTSVSNWNDRHDTTQEHVLEVFDRAIEECNG